MTIINSTYTIKFQKFWGNRGEKWNGKLDIKQFAFEVWTAAINSRNAEIKELKTRLMASEGAVKMLNDMDDENQKTILALRCCGNCDNIRATPQDHDFCWNNNGNLPSERICKDWTRKPK